MTMKLKIALAVAAVALVIFGADAFQRSEAQQERRKSATAEYAKHSTAFSIGFALGRVRLRIGSCRGEDETTLYGVSACSDVSLRATENWMQQACLSCRDPGTSIDAQSELCEKAAEAIVRNAARIDPCRDR